MMGRWASTLVAVLWVWLLLAPGAPVAHEHEWGELVLHRAPPGIRAPELSLLDLKGHRLSLADLRGRSVLLNFWASWCELCEAEMASMQRLQDGLRGTGLLVVGVNYKESGALVRAYVQERGLRFAMLLDPDGAVFERYRAQTLPFSVLVDPSGHVRAVAEGPRDWSSAAAMALMRRLAGERY